VKNYRIAWRELPSQPTSRKLNRCGVWSCERPDSTPFYFKEGKYGLYKYQLKVRGEEKVEIDLAEIIDNLKSQFCDVICEDETEELECPDRTCIVWKLLTICNEKFNNPDI
jgi:hypothetical protein